MLEEHWLGTDGSVNTFHSRHRSRCIFRLFVGKLAAEAVFTCSPFEGDTIKFLEKASAGKRVEMYLMFMFKVIALQVLCK